MNRLLLILLIAGILSESATSQSACHQPSTRAWIQVEPTTGDTSTLWFGFDSSGTCGVDTQLCEILWPWGCGDLPPVGEFCAIWYVGDYCAPENLGTLVSYDYRGFHGRTQIDTFELTFYSYPLRGFYPVKLCWSRASVVALYDSIVIEDAVTGGTLTSIRMDHNDSLLLMDYRIQDLWLIGYGAKPNSSTSVPLEMPRSLLVYQNYPNPFNPGTVIRYQLLNATRVTLKVYNVLGQEMATLVNRMEEPGFKSVEFNGRGKNGSMLPSGVYFYRIQAEGFSAARKMLLLR